MLRIVRSCALKMGVKPTDVGSPRARKTLLVSASARPSTSSIARCESGSNAAKKTGLVEAIYLIQKARTRHRGG